MACVTIPRELDIVITGLIVLCHFGYYVQERVTFLLHWQLLHSTTKETGEPGT